MSMFVGVSVTFGTVADAVHPIWEVCASNLCSVLLFTHYHPLPTVHL